MMTKDLVIAALTAIFTTYDPEAARTLLADDYIQHNPAVPTGAAPIVGFIPALEKSGIRLTTHRVLAEGDLVVTHSTYESAHLLGGPTMVAFDVFRVEDGRIAEHWDNLAPLTPPNPSGRTQTDGPTEVAERDRTAANRALVVGFVETVLQGGDAARLTDFISAEHYHQHNPEIADGLSGLGAALAAWAAQGIAIHYDRLHLVVAEGNFVFTASEGALGDTPTAFFDLFRVADGRIVEHWDVVAPIPAEMAHRNGKF